MERLSLNFVDLYSSIIDDLYLLYPKILKRGIKKYLINRIKNEGFSFLGKVLPSLAAGFLQSLDEGVLSPSLFSSVSKSSPLGAIILSGFGGCDSSIAVLLQLCNFFKKVVTDNDEVEEDTINKFVSKNSSRKEVKPRAYFNDYVETILRNVIIPELDSEYKSAIETGRLDFRDGPGSTSQIGKIRGEENNKQFAYANLDLYSAKRGFPYDPFLNGVEPRAFIEGYKDDVEKRYHSEFERQYKESFPESMGLRGDCPHATIVCVPKSFTSKRIIAKDNVYAVRRQMALMDIGYRAICKLFPRNNLKDQSLNQRLARIGSCTKEYVTVDIKDGSNTVPLHVVEEWFKDSLYFRMFWHVRTSRYIIPGITNQGSDFDVIIPKISYATGHVYMDRHKSQEIHMAFSQGSPGCFLTLVLYLSCISAASVLEHFCLHMGFNVESLTGDEVRLFFDRFIRCTTGPSHILPFAWYGDDGILRLEYYRHFLAFAKEYGADINVDKTFERSNLRESCGPYYYRGVNITPIKPSFYVENIVHQQFNLLNSDDVLVKYASICHELYDNGFYTAFHNLYEQISGIPFNESNSHWFNCKKWRKKVRRMRQFLFLLTCLLGLNYKLWTMLSMCTNLWRFFDHSGPVSPFSYWDEGYLDILTESQFKFCRYFSTLYRGKPVLVNERGTYEYTYEQRLRSMEVCANRKFEITPLSFERKKVRVFYSLITFGCKIIINAPVVTLSYINKDLHPLRDELVPDILPSSFVRARSTSVKSY
jgi:hypothetical protein